MPPSSSPFITVLKALCCPCILIFQSTRIILCACLSVSFRGIFLWAQHRLCCCCSCCGNGGGRSTAALMNDFGLATNNNSRKRDQIRVIAPESSTEAEEAKRKRRVPKTGGSETPRAENESRPNNLQNSIKNRMTACVTIEASKETTNARETAEIGKEKPSLPPRRRRQRVFFEDPDFPPNAKSLGDLHKGSNEWVRLEDFIGQSDTRAVLVNGTISPADIMQGTLGDCWLLAAMAAVAEWPALVRKIFVVKQRNTYGKYTFRLFDEAKDAFVDVSVDTYVPVKRGKPRFCSPKGGEMWVPLLEKAVAKLMGSYSALESGSTAKGIAVLTGARCVRLALQPNGWIRTNRSRVYTGDEVFEVVHAFTQYQCIMTCSINEGEAARGISNGHAYTLLGAYRFGDIELVKVRNPWGTVDWRGAWADGSAEWAAHPEIASALGRHVFEVNSDGEAIIFSSKQKGSFCSSTSPSPSWQGERGGRGSVRRGGRRQRGRELSSDYTSGDDTSTVRSISPPQHRRISSREVQEENFMAIVPINSGDGGGGTASPFPSSNHNNRLLIRDQRQHIDENNNEKSPGLRHCLCTGDRFANSEVLSSLREGGVAGIPPPPPPPPRVPAFINQNQMVGGGDDKGTRDNTRRGRRRSVRIDGAPQPELPYYTPPPPPQQQQGGVPTVPTVGFGGEGRRSRGYSAQGTCIPPLGGEEREQNGKEILIHRQNYLPTLAYNTSSNCSRNHRMCSLPLNSRREQVCGGNGLGDDENENVGNNWHSDDTNEGYVPREAVRMPYRGGHSRFSSTESDSVASCSSCVFVDEASVCRSLQPPCCSATASPPSVRSPTSLATSTSVKQLAVGCGFHGAHAHVEAAEFGIALCSSTSREPIFMTSMSGAVAAVPPQTASPLWESCKSNINDDASTYTCTPKQPQSQSACHVLSPETRLDCEIVTTGKSYEIPASANRKLARERHHPRAAHRDNEAATNGEESCSQRQGLDIGAGDTSRTYLLDKEERERQHPMPLPSSCESSSSPALGNFAPSNSLPPPTLPNPPSAETGTRANSRASALDFSPAGTPQRQQHPYSGRGVTSQPNWQHLYSRAFEDKRREVHAQNTLPSLEMNGGGDTGLGQHIFSQRDLVVEEDQEARISAGTGGSVLPSPALRSSSRLGRKEGRRVSHDQRHRRGTSDGGSHDSAILLRGRRASSGMSATSTPTPENYHRAASSGGARKSCDDTCTTTASCASETGSSAYRPREANKDGTFFMSSKDFFEIFDYITVGIRTSGGFGDIAYNPHEECYCCGPCVGLFTGCFKFWCRCRGVKALFCARAPDPRTDGALSPITKKEAGGGARGGKRRETTGHI